MCLWIWRRLITVSLKVSCWVLQEYGVDGLLLLGLQSLYCWSQSLVYIADSKSDPFPVRVGLCQGLPLSLVLYIIFMDRISLHSQVVERIGFGGLRIPSLLFVDDVVLLASLNGDLQLSLGTFTANAEAGGMKISTSKSEAVVLSLKMVVCPLRGGGESPSPCGRFQESHGLIHK